jgi:tRNA-specific 2-thiouridylase
MCAARLHVLVRRCEFVHDVILYGLEDLLQPCSLLLGWHEALLTHVLLMCCYDAVQTVQIWFQEDFRNFWDACPWEEDLDFAKKVGSELHSCAVVNSL